VFKSVVRGFPTCAVHRNELHSARLLNIPPQGHPMRSSHFPSTLLVLSFMMDCTQLSYLDTPPHGTRAVTAWLVHWACDWAFIADSCSRPNQSQFSLCVFSDSFVRHVGRLTCGYRPGFNNSPSFKAHLVAYSYPLV